MEKSRGVGLTAKVAINGVYPKDNTMGSVHIMQREEKALSCPGGINIDECNSQVCSRLSPRHLI